MKFGDYFLMEGVRETGKTLPGMLLEESESGLGRQNEIPGTPGMGKVLGSCR